MDNQRRMIFVYIARYCFVIVFVACSIVDNSHQLDKSFNDSLASKIDTVATVLHGCIQYPGLTVAVVRIDKETQESQKFIRNYGVRDVGNEDDTSTSVDDGTRFCIGSVTKTFTAALLAQLLHENKTYSLDSPVKNTLGLDFELCDDERTSKTTARDLLAHKVGVAKHFGAFLLGYNLTRANIVRKVRQLPALKPFRSSRVFNNFMYVIAGQLAERLNGTWWENQIQWKFLNKLQMKRTTFADRVSDWTNNIAVPHALDNGKLVPLRAKVTGNILRPLGPAGSICTTATDMASWIQMLMQNGTDTSGNQILSPEVIQELFKVQNKFFELPRKSPDGAHFVSEGYGLGWTIGSYRNHTRAFHSGFSNYYHSMVSIMPDDGVGIFTALNGPHLIKCDNGMKALHLFITDTLLGEKSQLDATNICLYPRNKPSTTTTTTMTTPSEDQTDATIFDSEITEITSEESPITSPSPSPPASPTNTSATFGSRFLRRRLSSNRRRRPSRSTSSRHSKLLPFLEPYLGTYNNPFFGDVLINVNLSAPALQFNYGYYGKALLEPVSTASEPIVFRLHFFSSIWYQSESDDMKLFSKLGMFDIQFGKSDIKETSGKNDTELIDKLVVFLFDTQKPPIFSKIF